jgi:class 3 adenylate cyclase/streptogramin lyase
MMTRAREGHVLATVLFTDIVDSSRLATELGDRRWRVLLTRHHDIVRKALKKHGGREVDNAGDGFFASFDDQADAIRCACEISDGVKILGVDVRAGCHVGQAEVVGRKLGGVTVHAGARVMSEAGPGEVLVSGVMKDLVPASGFTFVDRGLHALKGIDGEWRLFAVTAVDGNPRPSPLEPDEAERSRQAVQPPPLVRRRWARVLIPAIALVFAAAAVLEVANRPQPIRLEANSLARIDPATNRIIADVPVADPGGSQLTAVPPHEVWVLSQQDQLISIVDTLTGDVQPIGVFGGQVGSTNAGYGIVYAHGFVWVSGGNDEVARIDPGSRGLAGHPSHIHIPGKPALLAAGYGRVWVGVHDRNLVVAINPTTDSVALEAPIGFGFNGIGVGEGWVWASNCESGTVSKIDPRTGESNEIDVGIAETVTGIAGETPQLINQAGCPATIATAFGSAWVSDPILGVVYRIDPGTDQVVDHIRVGEPSHDYASDIVEADGSMWVASPKSQTIVRIDPVTDQVEARISVSYKPNGLTVADGSVWVTLNPID